jgi:putative transposase
VCQILEVDRSTYHYKSRRPGQASLESKVKEICQTRVRYGYRRVHVLLRREGWLINQKKTRRIYRELGLQLRNKTPKRMGRSGIDPRLRCIIVTAIPARRHDKSRKL